VHLVVVWKLNLVRKKCWKKTCMTSIWYWLYWLPSGNIKTLVYPHYNGNRDAMTPPILLNFQSLLLQGGCGGMAIFRNYAIWLSHVSVIFGINHSLKRLAPDIYMFFFNSWATGPVKSRSILEYYFAYSYLRFCTCYVDENT
jgi:hypothetical protein